MAEDIIDRLKAEGDLLRNTGTNSIRSVKISLDKFNDVFSVISDNIARQTEMMAKSLDIQLDNFKISRETEEREETKEQIEELENDQENTKIEKVEKEKEDSDSKGLFALLGGMSLKKLLMGGALVGAGLFAAYNLAKGFVDELTDGGWTRFEQGLVDMVKNVDWAKIGESIKSISTSLLRIGEALPLLLDIIQGFIDNPWSLFAIGLGFGAGKFAAGLIGSGIKKLVGGTAAAAATAASSGLANAFKSLSKLIPGAGAAAAAAPLAVTAGTVAVLGNAVNSKLEMEEQYPELRGLNNGAGVGVVQGRYLIENGLIDQTIQEQRNQGTYRPPMGERPAPVNPPDFTGALPSPGIGNSNQNELQEYLHDLEVGDLRARRNEIDNRLTEMEAAGKGTGDPECQSLLDELMENGLRLMEMGMPVGVDPRFIGDQSSLQMLPSNARSIDTASMLRSITAGNDILRGGSGSDMLADRISAATSGGSSVVVINNSPTISPVTNNVQGGSSIATSNFFGSGGGSNITAYGLPSAIS